MSSELIEELVRVLKNFTIDDVFEIERNYDPQYAALAALYRNMEKPEEFLLIIILNAIVSYQLTGTGEQYWWEFSKYFSKNNIEGDEIDSFIRFLKTSRFNARLREAKIKRLLKLRNFISLYRERITKYVNSPSTLMKDLAKSLDSRENSKTIVFAIKMFHYGARIAGLTKKPLPYEIPIPVDSRIKQISNKLGIQKNIQEFWSKISRKIQIPPLHLDSLLWITLGYIRRKEKIKERKLEELAKLLKKINLTI